MSRLKNFIEEYAELYCETYKEDHKHYEECINNDAIEGDKWLDNKTSYIWKVGVLCLTDSNKCDWVNVLVGVQRDKETEPYLVAKFYFPEGENDDCGRVINRAMRMLEWMHPTFEEIF